MLQHKCTLRKRNTERHSYGTASAKQRRAYMHVCLRAPRRSAPIITARLAIHKKTRYMNVCLSAGSSSSLCKLLLLVFVRTFHPLALFRYAWWQQQLLSFVTAHAPQATHTHELLREGPPYFCAYSSSALNDAIKSACANKPQASNRSTCKRSKCWQLKTAECLSSCVGF